MSLDDLDIKKAMSEGILAQGRMHMLYVCVWMGMKVGSVRHFGIRPQIQLYM